MTAATMKRALLGGLAAAAIALPTAAPAIADDTSTSTGIGYGQYVDPAASPLPQGAESFVVADLDTGDILAAQNAHEARPPASTLKMLTALTVLPRVDLDTVYTAVDQDVAVEGSKVGIVPGSTYTVRQLFEAMFLVSGNDAANAVANVNGGVENTVEQMKSEANRIQAYDTVVRNPNGLDAPGQVSSAYDLALMARSGMSRKDFAGFAGLSNSTFPMDGTGDPTARSTFQIWNQNTLVTGGYEGAIGVKSGYTTNAGRTFAAAAERDGHRFLVTLMGISGNTYTTGATYLDWAFANADAAPVGRLASPKFTVSQTDAAVVQTDQPARTVAAVGSSGRSGHGLALAAAIATVLSCLLIWAGLRLQQRRAWRHRARPQQHDVDVRERGPALVPVREDARV